MLIRHKLTSFFEADAYLKVLTAVVTFLLLDPQPVLLPLLDEVLAARSTSQAGRQTEAADHYATASAWQPWDRSLQLQAGLAELAASRFEASRRHFLTLAALQGYNPVLHILLGDAYSGLSDQTTAILQWEAALHELQSQKLTPTQTQSDPVLLEAAQKRLADGYLALERWDEAAPMLAGLVVRHPDDAGSLYRLALITTAREPAAALPLLAFLTEISPQHAPDAASLAGAIEGALHQESQAYSYGVAGLYLLQLHEPSLAATAFRQAIVLEGNYAEAHAYLGLALEQQGQDGLPAFQAAVELAPESPLVHSLLGMYWRSAGHADRALSELETAFRLDPLNSAAAAELGATNVDLGSYETAEAWFLQAAELSPQDENFWILLAGFYADNEIDVRSSGLSAALHALAANPQSAAAHDVLGHLLFLNGSLTGARNMLSRALALQPDLASAHYHLGLLHAAQDHPREARAEFGLALQSDPGGHYGSLASRALAALSPQ